MWAICCCGNKSDEPHDWHIAWKTSHLLNKVFLVDGANASSDSLQYSSILKTLARGPRCTSQSLASTFSPTSYRCLRCMCACACVRGSTALRRTGPLALLFALSGNEGFRSGCAQGLPITAPLELAAIQDTRSWWLLVTSRIT